MKKAIFLIPFIPILISSCNGHDAVHREHCDSIKLIIYAFHGGRVDTTYFDTMIQDQNTIAKLTSSTSSSPLFAHACGYSGSMSFYYQGKFNGYSAEFNWDPECRDFRIDGPSKSEYRRLTDESIKYLTGFKSNVPDSMRWN